VRGDVTAVAEEKFPPSIGPAELGQQVPSARFYWHERQAAKLARWQAIDVAECGWVKMLSLFIGVRGCAA
jgi:hypothetical protein